MDASALEGDRSNPNNLAPAKEMGVAGKVVPAGVTAKDAKVVQAAETAVEKAVVRKEGKAEDTVPYRKLLSTADSVDYLLMLGGCIGAMGNGIAWPVFAMIFSQFTDTFGSPGDDFMSNVSKIALNFVYLAIGAMVGSYIQASMWMWTGNRQTSRIRQRYLQGVLRQNIAFFDTQATTGALLQGLNDDSAAVQAAISEKVAHFVQHMTTATAGIIVAFVGGWDMTLVMIGVLPFLAAVGMTLAKVTTVMQGRTTEAYSKSNSLAQQSLSQIRTVAAYCGEERAVQVYDQSLEGPTRSGIRQSLYTGLSLGGANAIVYFSYAIAFYYGAWRVSTGHYTGGQVLQVFVAALLGGFSIGQAAPVLETFAKGRSAGARIFRVIERVPEIDPEDESGATPEKVEGALELRNVDFCYPARPDVMVMRGFSLVIPAGKTVALVGSSGSGKSTVVQLIERFYDPSAGAVLLDGIDLRSLQVKWLRQQVGLVSQEPTLFATTIFENIAMGRSGATLEEVKAAAEAANAATFIAALPEGYNTQVGERGLQMSGGQKQRIAIARAILKNPKIMLLDEATSALDTQSERIVQDALERMIVGRTTVVVAHRLSTIQDADIIAVVKKGQVVELGSHNELIQDPIGAYSTLVKLQMQEEAAKAEDGELEGVEEGIEEVEGLEDGQSHMQALVASGLEPKSSLHTSGAVLVDANGHTAITVADTLSPAGSGNISRAGSAPISGAVEMGRTSRNRTSLGARPARQSSEQLPTKDADGKKGDKKGDKKNEEPKADVPFSRLVKLNRPEWGWGILGLIASGGNGAVQPAFAFIISSFITIFYNTDSGEMMHKASFWSWMYFVIGCGVLLASVGQQWAFGHMGCELARRVRRDLFRSMLYSEIGWHDEDRHSSGILTTKLATEASYVRGAVGDTLGLMLQNVLCLIFGYIIAFAYDWRMALVVTGALPMLIASSMIYYKNVTGRESEATTLFASANQAVSDAVTSIRVVQAYNLQKHMGALYERLVGGVAGTMVRQSQITGVLMGYSQFTIFALYGLIIWFGGLEVDSGRVDFDGMLKAFLAILLAAMGVAQAQIGFPDIGKAKDAIRGIFPIIDRKPLIDASSQDGIQAPPRGGLHIQGEVELKDVQFAYPARPSVIVFRNFSLHIPAGKMVALVGESGSGKSTIVGLTLRFYDVLGGSVSIDGVDVRSYNLRWLRSQIGLVSQEPLLFSMSVLDNIRYGKPDASMEEVEAAARAANAHEFITSLPEGYNTLVGEQGVQLSGGQKQRVAIARAVIKDPRIMLLDEATSALDAQSEKVVQEALDAVMAGRTSIVVAHRLSTIRNADKIALVQRGVILEEGTHAELVTRPDGAYARLVEAQMGRAGTMSRAQVGSMVRNTSAARLASASQASVSTSQLSSNPGTPKHA